jgi:hypothetical protein
MKTRIIFLFILLPFIFLFNGNISAQYTACPGYDFALTPTATYQTHSSSIISGGWQQYRVAVTVGNTYRFSFCEGGGTAIFDSYMTLYDNSCGYLTYNDDYCSLLSELDYTATYTGYAYFTVSGYSSSDFGTYTLAYKYTAPSCPAYNNSITPTTTYQTHSGSIDAGSWMQYQVAVTAGNTYRFSFCEGGGSAGYDSYLTLRDNTCAFLTANDDYCGLQSQLDYTATYTGFMYLEVNSCCTGGSGGSYTLAYKYTAPSCPVYNYDITPTLTYQAHSGSIDAGSWTQYRVAVTAGNTYRFSFCEGGGTASYDSYLTLRDNTCAFLTSNDDNCGLQSQLDYTATYTGYAYLEVNSYSSSYSGTYTLAYRFLGPCDLITIIPDCGVANSITSSHSGSGAGWNVTACGYSTFGQEQIYQYTPIVSGTYSIVVTASSGSFVDYFYKDAALGCDANNWTCISDVFSAGTYGSFSLTAGTTYYFLLDAEGTAAVDQTFYLPCPPRPCASCVPVDVALGTIGTTVYGYSISGNLGHDGKWSGSFNGEAGKVYHFDLCPDAPGAGLANFDIDIKITDGSCSILAGEDGGCSSGVSSYQPNDYTWTCPAAGTYYVILAPFLSFNSHNCSGIAGNTFTMEYYKEVLPVVCPPNVTVVENEPDCYNEYVDVTNGGCNISPEVYTELTGCNDVVCGKSGTYTVAGTDNRDTDWYRLLLNANTTVNMKVIADFPLQILVIDLTAGCPSLSIISSTTAAAGDTAYLSTSFGPGTLAYWVGPSVFNGVPCGSNYVMYCNTVAVSAPTTPVIADIPACGPTQLNGMTSPGGVTYYWQGNSCGASTANPASSPYPVSTTDTYYVRAIDNTMGCWSTCTPIDVTILDSPVPTAFANSNPAGVSVCTTDSVLLTGSCASPTGEVLYRWLKGPQVIRDWSVDSAFMVNTTHDTVYTLETGYTVPPDVLVLYSDDTYYDCGLISYLTADGRFGTVTGYDAYNNPTPTVASLLLYGVVVTLSDYLYYDQDAMGDTLKAFIDAGGKLVTLYFAQDINWGITGDYLADAYDPIEQSTALGNSSSSISTVFFPSHPIMAGVTNIDPQYHLSTSNVTAGAIPIFVWADGFIGAATKTIGAGEIVSINFFPGLDLGTDGDLMIANSAYWLGSRVVSPCTSTDNVPVTIVPVPGAAGTITGATTTCDDLSGIPYSVVTIPNASTYSWNYSGTGVTINGTGNAVTLDYALGATSGNLTVLGTNSCGVNGTSNFISIVVTSCVGIEENNSGISVQIVPNPNPGVFNIQMSSDNSTTYGLKIYNSLGQIVMERSETITTGVNRIDVNMADQPTGNYYLTLVNDQNSIVKAFIISK